MVLKRAHLTFASAEAAHPNRSKGDTLENMNQLATKAEVSPRQLEVMRHAMGVDARMINSYRNRFVTDSTSEDGADCEALVASGMMAKSPACALGHCDSTGPDSEGGVLYYSTHRYQISIVSVNDGCSRYPQPTPKSRVLAYLRDLKAGVK